MININECRVKASPACLINDMKKTRGDVERRRERRHTEMMFNFRNVKYRTDCWMNYILYTSHLEDAANMVGSILGYRMSRYYSGPDSRL